MAYTYRVDVSLTANVEVEAESYAVAKELAEEWLNLESLDNRVSMPSTDGLLSVSRAMMIQITIKTGG